jgi:hypothetical protein
MTSSIKVLGAAHTGITVRSLSNAIQLFRDVLNLPISRHNHASPPTSSIVGHPQAEIETCIVELPGGHLIELLEYCSPPQDERKVLKPMSWDVGSWHMCLTVENLDRTIETLEALKTGWSKMAKPLTVESGPNAGRRVVYMRNEQDGMILEFFEQGN